MMVKAVDMLHTLFHVHPKPKKGCCHECVCSVVDAVAVAVAICWNDGRNALPHLPITAHVPAIIPDLPG